MERESLKHLQDSAEPSADHLAKIAKQPRTPVEASVELIAKAKAAAPEISTEVRLKLIKWSNDWIKRSFFDSMTGAVHEEGGLRSQGSRNVELEIATLVGEEKSGKRDESN